MPAVLIGVAEEAYGLLQTARIDILKRFHASTPRILSRVMGRSRTRRPMAFATALPTAATVGMMVGSPNVLAPKGPYGSSVSIHSTSISGASRWVITRAP